MSTKQDVIDTLYRNAKIFAGFGPETVAQQQFKYIRDLYNHQPEIFKAAFEEENK